MAKKPRNTKAVITAYNEKSGQGRMETDDSIHHFDNEMYWYQIRNEKGERVPSDNLKVGDNVRFSLVDKDGLEIESFMLEKDYFEMPFNDTIADLYMSFLKDSNEKAQLLEINIPFNCSWFDHPTVLAGDRILHFETKEEAIAAVVWAAFQSKKFKEEEVLKKLAEAIHAHCLDQKKVTDAVCSFDETVVKHSELELIFAYY